MSEVPAHIAKVRAQMRAELEREIARGQRVEQVQDAANELIYSNSYSDLWGPFEADMGWGE